MHAGTELPSHRLLLLPGLRWRYSNLLSANPPFIPFFASNFGDKSNKFRISCLILFVLNSCFILSLQKLRETEVQMGTSECSSTSTDHCENTERFLKKIVSEPILKAVAILVHTIPV
jgi:hypothetical protein